MTQEEPNLSAIEQLDQAVHTVPPNVAAARLAIGALAEELPGLDREQSVHIAQQAAALCGELAVSAGSEYVAGEFGTHQKTYGALAQLLGGSSEQQAAATNTAGKEMSGGKQ